MAVLLIGIIFVGFILVVPAIVSMAGGSGGILSGIQDFINNILGGLGLGGNSTGYTAVAFRINYVDGTHEDVTPKFGGYSLLPMSVTYGGKEILSVEPKVNAQVVGDEVGAWSTTTSMRIEFYKSGESVPKTSSTGSYSQSGSGWASGTVKTIAATTIAGSTMNSVVQQYATVSSDWVMQVTCQVQLKATVGGVSGNYTASAPAASITFRYNAGGSLQSFSVSISISPLTATYPWT